MANLSTKRPKTLAKLLQTIEDRWQTAIDVIFDLSLNGEERVQSIITRLGDKHPAIVAFRKIDAERNILYLECRRRYGSTAVTFDSGWITFLLVRV